MCELASHIESENVFNFHFAESIVNIENSTIIWYNFIKENIIILFGFELEFIKGD